MKTDFGPLSPTKLRNRIDTYRARYQLSQIDRYAKKIPDNLDSQGRERFADTLSATINSGAGLGHQLSGWIAGDLWAHDLGLQTASGNVPADRNRLFAFDSSLGQPPAAHKVVHLPAVPDERDPRSWSVLKAAVVRAQNNCPDMPIRFQLSLDQARWDQTAAAGPLRAAVLSGNYGSQLREAEGSNPGYIAVHIRRGDVGRLSTGGSGESRWVDLDWYKDLIADLRRIPDLRDLEMRIYSQGDQADFATISDSGTTIILDGERDQDFVGLCGARLLIAAPSSFSFTAALVSRGAVIVRSPWWHRLPDGGRWVSISSGAAVAPELVKQALTHASDIEP